MAIWITIINSHIPEEGYLLNLLVGDNVIKNLLRFSLPVSVAPPQTRQFLFAYVFVLLQYDCDDIISFTSVTFPLCMLKLCYWVSITISIYLFI
jgi:hypothetical protein